MCQKFSLNVIKMLVSRAKLPIFIAVYKLKFIALNETLSSFQLNKNASRILKNKISSPDKQLSQQL